MAMLIGRNCRAGGPGAAATALLPATDAVTPPTTPDSTVRRLTVRADMFSSGT
jgi:hypothetical protein